jgi:hypothetical protein
MRSLLRPVPLRLELWGYHVAAEVTHEKGGHALTL